MTAAQTAWVVSLVVAGGLLPVGAIRMLVYRSGDIDHTPTMRTVAVLALVAGGVALIVWAVLTVWFLATGTSPA